MYLFACEPDFDKLSLDYNINNNLHYTEVDGNKYHFYISQEFSEESGQLFEANFMQLLKESGIEEHYDNLLYVILGKHDEQCMIYERAVNRYHDNKRNKEMANLILLLNEIQHSRDLKITISSPKDKATVTDDKLTNMIVEVLNKEIDEWNDRQPLASYGESFMQSFIPNLQDISLTRDKERLTQIAQSKNPHYNKLNAKMKAELCLHTYPYLQNQTPLNAVESRYSNNQYRFWFKLFKALNIQDEITSPETDYIAAILSNHTRS